MKVLLVQPRQTRRTGFRAGFRTMAAVEPLGIEMVAGALGREHDVQIVDLLPGTDLLSRASSFAPDACGISCSFTVDVPETLRIAAALKALPTRPLVFVGGHHASLVPEDFACDSVDGVVEGEGEAVLPELLRTLDGGGDPSEVPGLVLRGADGQMFTGERSLIDDLDNLPFPRRDLTAPWRRDYHLGVRGSLASVETSRGCPYRCRFCSVWRFYQGNMRFKSPARVVDELESLEARNVFITDDNFLGDVDRANAIADLLLARGVRKRFIAQARTDALAAHPELVRRLKEAGLATVFVGIEKIDQGRLAAVRKGSTVESNEKALRILEKAGVIAYATLIVDPDYDAADFRRLRSYVRQQRIPNPWFTILTPLPGTSLFDDLQEVLTTRDWEFFDLLHAVTPTKLDLAAFYREFCRLYTSHYTPGYLSRRALRALVRRGDRGLPRPFHLWRTLYSYRFLASPKEYLSAHQTHREILGSGEG